MCSNNMVYSKFVSGKNRNETHHRPGSAVIYRYSSSFSRFHRRPANIKYCILPKLFNIHEQIVKIQNKAFLGWGLYYLLLTLKAPRKTAFENVVCLCRLQNILANFSNLFFAYRQTVWTLIRLLLKEQSDLGPHCLQK